MTKKKSAPAPRYLPAICKVCRGDYIEVIHEPERLLIQCATCGARIYTFYDPIKDRVESGEFARLKIRRIENDLLEDLSPATRAVYIFIRTYAARSGFAPTIREIQQSLGLRSLNSVSYHLTKLEDVALIQREWGIARGIHLLYAMDT